jgi:hypothetical protein
LGEVLGVGIGDDAQGLVTEFELRVAEEGVVGGGDEPPGHLQDGVGGTRLDAGRQLLGLGFEFGAERFGHGGLRLGKIPPVIPNYAEVNPFPTNYHHAYPGRAMPQAAC